MARTTGTEGRRQFLRRKIGGLRTVHSTDHEMFLLRFKETGDLILPHAALETKPNCSLGDSQPL